MQIVTRRDLALGCLFAKKLFKNIKEKLVSTARLVKDQPFGLKFRSVHKA